MYDDFYKELDHREKVFSPRLSHHQVHMHKEITGSIKPSLYNHIAHMLDAEIMKANNEWHRGADGSVGYERDNTLQFNLLYAQERAEEFYKAMHPECHNLPVNSGYMCANCGGGFNREEMNFDTEYDADLCSDCYCSSEVQQGEKK